MRRTAAFLGFIAVCCASSPTNRAPVQRAPQPSPLPAAGDSPEEYLKRYAGAWVPEFHNVSDAHEWKIASQDAFMKKYATEYRSYVFNWQRLSTLVAAAPQDPSKCDTLTCLKQWLDTQLDKIKEYVPETWRPLAENSLKKEYMWLKKKMEAKLQKPNSSHAGAGANSSQAEASVNSSHAEAGANSSHIGAGLVELAASIQPLGMSPAWYISRYAGDRVPTVRNASDGQEWWKNFTDDRVAQFAHYEQDSARLAKEFGDAPAIAGDCHTLGDLKKWRDAQLASIHAFEPKAFQGFATKAVNDEYESNSARIAKEEAAKTAERDEARIAKEEAAKPAKSANASEVPSSLMALPEFAQAESYMGDYADQWVPHAQSSESWSPESYMGDYADHWIPHDQSNKSLSPESYVNQYAAGYTGDYVPALSYRDEWQQRFTGSYVEADRHYAADADLIQRKFANAPQKASECHTLEALKQWREAQRARMGAFVPKMWQRIASDSIDREFEADRERIAQERASNATGSERATNATGSERADNVTGSEPVQFVSFADSMDQFAEQWMPSSASGVDVSPEWYINRYGGNSVPRIHNASDGCAWRRNFLSRYAEAYEQFANDSQRLSQEYVDVPRRARDAHDMNELEAWKGAQLARIHAFVAHTFQGLAEDSVERAFRKGRARLQEVAASVQNGTQAARPAAAASNNTGLATESGAGSSSAAAVLVLVTSLGALTVAFASRAARHWVDGEEVEDVYVQV